MKVLQTAATVLIALVAVPFALGDHAYTGGMVRGFYGETIGDVHICIASGSACAVEVATWEEEIIVDYEYTEVWWCDGSTTTTEEGSFSGIDPQNSPISGSLGSASYDGAYDFTFLSATLTISGETYHGTAGVDGPSGGTGLVTLHFEGATADGFYSLTYEGYDESGVGGARAERRECPHPPPIGG